LAQGVDLSQYFSIAGNSVASEGVPCLSGGEVEKSNGGEERPQLEDCHDLNEWKGNKLNECTDTGKS
jgi:hypothetical protein